MPFVRDLIARVSTALGQSAVPDVQTADGAHDPTIPPTVDEGQVAVVLEKGGTRTWVVVLDPDARHLLTIDGEAWHHVTETTDGAWVYAPTRE